MIEFNDDKSIATALHILISPYMYMCMHITIHIYHYEPSVVHLQVKSLLDELIEKLPEEFNLPELQSKVEEKTPYILVALQECERMNNLTREIRRSLKELDLGLKVDFVCMMI